MMTDLQATAVLPHLTTRWLGRPYYYHETIGSTNDWLKELVARGSAQDPPAGTVALANFQNQGRGRLERRWEAPAGSSLLFSLLLRPHWPAEKGNWLTMMASLAAVRAIGAVCALPTGIKWPNDVMVRHQGQWRKAGGLLLEGDLDENGRFNSAIIGIGLNVNVPVEELPQAVTPATSLLAAAGKPVSWRALLLALLAELEQLLDRGAAGESPHAAWEARLITLSQQVQVTFIGNGRILHGTATGTNDWGHLLLTDYAGDVHTITAGDVTLRPSGLG